MLVSYSDAGYANNMCRIGLDWMELKSVRDDVIRDKKIDVKKDAIVKWLQMPLEPWSTDNLKARAIQF